MTERQPTANACQRARRVQHPRIDYYPGPIALAAIHAKRAQVRPRTVAGTNSGILDAIVTEWAALTGINNQGKSDPITPTRKPEFPDMSARANDSGDGGLSDGTPANKAKQRVVCGAIRRRDGQPCQALSEPGKRRCKWHGGCSTGPRTPEGKSLALANLRQNRNRCREGDTLP